MNHLGRKIREFLTAEDGPTAVEYAVMLLLIFMACIVVIQTIGNMLSDSFTASSDSIETAVQSSSS